MMQDSGFEFEEADKQFDLIFSTLRAGRSLAASYNLLNNIQRKSHAFPLFSGVF